MKPIKIGIVAESTGLTIRQAITQAARMAAAGVQIDAVGDLAPEALGETGRREFRNLLRSFNQELAALNVPLRHGLDVVENQQPRLEHIHKVMQLAFDLGARRVVVPCPKIADDLATPRAQTMRESLLALGHYGDRIGSVLALEIGYDPAETVKSYLSGFDTGSLKVTYDPANMLIHGHDPIANLNSLKAFLAHIHARDARSASLSRGLQEVPLGAGDVDWMTFTATLQVLEFEGFMVVEREQGENKLEDVANGVKFLRRFAMPVG
ncbi:MAG TPA: sugar phosphate isomerase/epimerase family protein [Gemmata sp.]|jgi:sugar phosphate isomerase/epimerase|nr:sugar phosphate isomerase/epimerase family protein [Gemmata sp.]